jgi:type III pantothenate kinase
MQQRYITADAGNTMIKFGWMENSTMISVERVEYKSLYKWLADHPELKSMTCVLSSVTSKDLNKNLELAFAKLFLVDYRVNLPVELNYLTPETLGIDRICNAAAIQALAPNSRKVSIDIGTCIKFDMVDENGCYQGGSISPGIELRYKSMNDYTANFPLLDQKDAADLIGRSTTGSMHSGVMNGILSEINDLIRRYQEEYNVLTFFLTGGNAHHFDFEGKNNIFADENLTLKGLANIYLLNAK